MTLTEPCQDVCSSWASIEDVCSPCDDYAFDTALLEDSLLAASNVLFNLTGRRWPGVCRDVIRPCRPDGVSCFGAAGIAASQLGLGPYATANGRPLGVGPSSHCGCGPLYELTLPGFPVLGVEQVKVDGDVVPATDYKVDDRHKLVGVRRADGTLRTWPICQRLDRADTEDSTWSVTYVYGLEPPIGGRMAAAALGCQLALACQPETVGSCRLPKRVTTITRQGVSIAVLDPLTLFADGMTGLPEVDMWVSSILIGDKRRRATVVVPWKGRNARRRS